MPTSGKQQLPSKGGGGDPNTPVDVIVTYLILEDSICYGTTSSGLSVCLSPSHVRYSDHLLTIG